MLTRLTTGELADRVWFALWADELGNRTRVDAYNRKTTNPLTGEPDAGNPPVRFGARGARSIPCPSPYPSQRCVNKLSMMTSLVFHSSDIVNDSGSNTSNISMGCPMYWRRRSMLIKLLGRFGICNRNT